MSDRYSQFFSMSLDMLCIAGTDGYFKELNPTWEQVLGYSQQELLAHPYIERVHPEDHEATIAEAQKLAAGGHETISFVNRYRTKDGNYVWLSWAARVSPSGDTLLAVARDITELKTVAERSREATMAAQMANRAKSEFLANMSHELRTPLNSIIGFSRILGRNRAKTLDDSQLDYIGRINKSGIHLLNLINDVLDISKVEAGRLEVVDEEVNLGQIVEEVTQEMMPQVTHKGISLLVEIPGDLVRLRGDAKRLQQIVTNLVGNAIKFTDQGAVWVRVIAREGRATRVDVIDSGIGISPDHQKRIFEPFAQADGTTARRYGGTGLGLSISHALAQMMGFSLVVDSEPGQGSTFSLLLDPQTETAPTHVRPEGLDNLRPPPPPREDEPAPAPARPSRPFPGDRSKRLLLIVDDDADARAVLEKTFAEDGYSVVAADSAATG
ncbi:MAG: ATP-binding protein, partial [Myxococcota bacterium]